MEGIGKFFDKFRNRALGEVHKRQAICDAVEKVTGQKIVMEDISLNGKIAVIKGNQGMKSEIFLKKKKILASIPNILSDIK